MTNFKYKWAAKAYLMWINFYIPLCIKIEGKKLVANQSMVMRHLVRNDRYIVYKGFVTQEMLDDLKNIKPFNPDELEDILKQELSEEIKKH